MSIHNHLASKGFTTKKSGHGLGLSWAVDKIATWNGEIDIESEHGEYTIIKIALPKTEVEMTVELEASLQDYNQLVVVDDDPAILKKWSDKAITKNIEYFGANTPKEFYGLKKELDENTLYIVDYDLGSKETGIDVIGKIRCVENVILATNNFDDLAVQEYCVKNEVGLLPKPMVHLFEFC